MKARIGAILHWLKTNLIVVISLFLCLLSMGGLYFIWDSGNAFVDKVTARNKEVDTISGLQKTSVPLPPEKPDDPPHNMSITVNQKAIDDVTAIYGKMNGEYNQISQFAISMNEQNHPPFMENLFPEPSQHTAEALAARKRYGRALVEMFEPRSANADYPQLDARPGLSPVELKAGLDDDARDFLAKMGKTSGTPLTPDESDKLQQEQAGKALAMLLARAKQTHLYAQINPTLPGFPFDIPPWALPGRIRPTDQDLWEGQMTLWILGDVARAIALTNRVENPDTNVIVAPIKRLVLASVVPGYAGNAVPSPDTSSPLIPRFELSSTGRVSNGLYDVRYVKLRMIVDWKRLPVFFDALAQVNFMTVTKMEVTDVDEYDALKDGYVYGSGDAVQVDMVIETIWFRDWTKKLMPDEVKKNRGVVPGPVTPGASSIFTVVAGPVGRR